MLTHSKLIFIIEDSVEDRALYRKFLERDNRYTYNVVSPISNLDEHNFILSVRDNGIGLPADLDIKKTKSLGMNLIQGLVKQLRGTLEIISQQGSEFKITFPATQKL